MFDRVSPRYDRTGPPVFSVFGEGLVRYAALRPGLRVLDVACGRGAVLFPACTAVGATGSVTGVDLSGGMVEATAEEAGRMGLAWARVIMADAEALPFAPSSFDAALCGLALPFLPRLDLALLGVRRVLVPGGTFACSTMQTHTGRAVFDELHERFGRHLREAPSAPTQDLAREDELLDALSQAGFAGLDSTCQEQVVRYGSAEEWWEALQSHGYRAYLEQLDPAVLPEFRKAALGLAEALRTERAFCDTWKVIYARGHA